MNNQELLLLLQAIFFAGLDPSLRHEMWPFLLHYYPYQSTHEEREHIRNDRYIVYQNLRKQREEMSPTEAEEFWRHVQCTVEKDVVRTDRSHPYFRGEDNPNIDILKWVILFDKILRTTSSSLINCLMVSAVIQGDPAKLCGGTPSLWLHAGHVRPPGSRSGGGPEWGGCLLVLCGPHAADNICFLSQGHGHGQTVGQSLHPVTQNPWGNPSLNFMLIPCSGICKSCYAWCCPISTSIWASLRMAWSFSLYTGNHPPFHYPPPTSNRATSI